MAIAQGGTKRETVLAVAGLMLVLFLVSLDQTVVGTAMPRIIAELKGFELYAWVTTAYLLAETTVIPIVGKLGDLYGRKWITVAGVAIFLVGSALSGISTSMIQLIVFRGLQGLGGGMLLSTVFTLVADIFPDPARRAKYQGFFFAVFAVSSVIGPILGGWITDSLNWRWVFYVNLPLGLVALATLPAMLTPLVLTMTAMGIIGGQLIARIGRYQPFLLSGTVMMTFGIFLLTTLGVGSSTGTVALFLFVTALGLGLVMPVTTLAVQSAVDAAGASSPLVPAAPTSAFILHPSFNGGRSMVL